MSEESRFTTVIIFPLNSHKCFKLFCFPVKVHVSFLLGIYFWNESVLQFSFDHVRSTSSIEYIDMEIKKLLAQQPIYWRFTVDHFPPVTEQVTINRQQLTEAWLARKKKNFPPDNCRFHPAIWTDRCSSSDAQRMKSLEHPPVFNWPSSVGVAHCPTRSNRDSL